MRWARSLPTDVATQPHHRVAHPGHEPVGIDRPFGDQADARDQPIMRAAMMVIVVGAGGVRRNRRHSGYVERVLAEKVLALSFARIFYRNAVDGAFLLPIEIDQNSYENISNGDELEVNIEKNEIKNLTQNQTYSMKPFSKIIHDIIAAGGLFKYKPKK